MREGRGSRPLPRFRSRAAKATGWATFFKYIIGCTQKPGAEHEMEDTYFKRGRGGHHWPPCWRRPWYVLEVYGAGAGKNSQTPAGADKKFQPAQDSVVERQQHQTNQVMLILCQPRKHLFCCEYFPGEISTKLNRYFYHCSSITFFFHYFVFLVVQGRDSSTK